MRFLCAGAVVVCCALGAASQGVDLAALDGWDIVVDTKASPSEANAGRQFQHFLERAGGGRLPIVAEVDRPNRHVFIGRGEAMQANPAGFDVSDFGEEDLRIVIGGDTIVIAGGRPRGTLYGVYTFLEDYLGVRFLTHDHIHVPPVGVWRAVGPVDRFYHPPLASRWSFYAETNRHSVFASQNRTNTVPTEPELGAKTTLENINHTFLFLMPSQAYGKAHPEYYAMVDGKRIAHVDNDSYKTQLCLTNPDVLRIMTDKVLAQLRANPDRKNVSVSQNDNQVYCTCPKCAAIDEREGTPMGSLLTFVNAIAEEVSTEFPDALVGTLAYQYSREAPEHLKPHPNVQIQLCSIECCMFHAIDDPDCAQNVEFCRDLAEWGAICSNVSIWNYNTNFGNYLLPCPNLRSIGPNIRYFVDNGAMGVFMQAVYNTTGGELSDLRNYVIANLLWDPNKSGETLIDEFLRLHYGPAAPPIRQFINLVHDNARDKNCHSKGCGGSAEMFGIDEHIAQTGMDAFVEALELAGDDPFLRARVEKASLCAYRAALEPYFALDPKSLADSEFIARMLPLREQFLALCEKYGVEKLTEGGTVEAFKTYTPPVAALTGRRVVQLPERWRFKTDPKNVGEGEAWFKQTPDESWETLSIHQPWEFQGHDSYDGYAWYTVEMVVPEVAERTLWILFGAVDETFDLWIDGERAGESKGAGIALWDKPVAIDITDKCTPGEKARFTMRVHDAGYAGGIWKPVWLTASD
ncbi:MAG: DUF4838 domain-containing protein [bacterium]|nr:DUF4838 domain-containing protein [bacterium]